MRVWYENARTISTIPVCPMKFRFVIDQVVSEVYTRYSVLMFGHGQYWTTGVFEMLHNGLECFLMFNPNKPVIDDIYDIHRK